MAVFSVFKSKQPAPVVIRCLPIDSVIDILQAQYRIEDSLTCDRQLTCAQWEAEVTRAANLVRVMQFNGAFPEHYIIKFASEAADYYGRRLVHLLKDLS